MESSSPNGPSPSSSESVATVGEAAPTTVFTSGAPLNGTDAVNLEYLPPRDAAGHDAFHPPEGLKKLNWYQMAFICFVVTSAGPFGCEPAVRAGGPLLALSVTILVPLLHVVPMTLLLTELSAWMPTPHGSVLWISRAYGDTIGFMSSIMQLLINLVDIAIYPVLIGDYVSQQFPVLKDNFWYKYALQVAVVLIGGIPPLLSTDDFSLLSSILTIGILMPFIVGVGAGLQGINGPAIVQVADNIDSPALVSTGIWMYTGYLALGSLGAEVQHHSVFIKGCLTAVTTSSILYILPLIVAFQVAGDWSDGFLLTAMDGILPGLGYGVMAAGICSGFGLFTSSITCFSRTCWGIADKGWFPHVFTRTSRTGSPYVAVLLHIFTSLFLVLFDFDFLVQFELVIGAINFVLFYTAFIVLRYQEPEREKRPFVVPGGMPAAWALIAPICTVYFGLFLSLCVKDWRIDVGVVACCGILFAVHRWVLLPNQRKSRHVDSERSLLEGEDEGGINGGQREGPEVHIIYSEGDARLASPKQEKSGGSDYDNAQEDDDYLSSNAKATTTAAATNTNGTAAGQGLEGSGSEGSLSSPVGQTSTAEGRLREKLTTAAFYGDD